MAAAILASLWLSRRLFEPESAPAIVAWWGLLIGFSSLVAWAVDRLARKLLPLTIMLKVTMLFPDRAPSRYRVALRRSNVAELRRRVAETEGDVSASAELILALGQSLNEHDRRTRGHGERTRAYTDMLAEELKIPEVDRDKLRWAALLHDIGKLEVPAEILNKDGPLDEAEMAVIRRHPLMGMRVAAPIVPWLGEWAGAIEHHHEWWDGTGYPRGLKGPEISLAARIVSVADAFDVMTSGRSYQTPKTPAEARREVTRMAGVQFDPMVARALMNVSLGRLRWALGPMTWLGQIPFYLDRLGRDFLTVSTAATLTAAAVVGGAIPIPTLLGDPPPAVSAQQDTTASAPLPGAPDAPDGTGSSPGAPGAPGTSPPTTTDTTPDTTATTIPGPTPPTTTPGTTPPSTPPTTTPGTTPPTTTPPPATPPTTAPPTTPPTTPPPTTPPPPPPPTVNPDVASTDEDESVSIDVLANDGPELTISSVTSAPGAGTAQIIGTRITYAPTPNANGTDTFGYRACHPANGCADSTVAVRVNAVNDGPIAANDSASTIWGTAVTVAVLANDVDIDGDVLSVTSVRLRGKGTITTNGTTVTYVGPPRFTGVVTVTYTACDPTGACASAVATITVQPGERPPNAVNDSASANRSGNVNVRVLDNDSDPDGDLDRSTLAIVIQPAHGTADVLRSGLVRYRANSGFSGTDTFTYRVCDSIDLCDTAVVTITVQ